MNNTTDNYHAEEISLRDLYLIIKKAFIPAVIVALVVGVATFVYMSMQPKVYTAETTTLVTPLISEPSFSLGQETLRVASGTTVSYEAYEAIAMSRNVLTEVLAAVPGYEHGATALRKQLSLKKLVGPANVTQVAPLSVVHTAEHNSPEVAAKIADEWAEITIRTISESMLDDLRPIVTATTQALETAQITLDDADERLRTFEENSSVTVLEQEYQALGEELRALGQTLRLTEGERSAFANQLESLEASLEEERILALVGITTRETYLLRAQGILSANESTVSPVFTAGLIVIGETLLATSPDAELQRTVDALAERTTPENIANIRVTIAQQNGTTTPNPNALTRSVVDELRIAVFETRGSLRSAEGAIERAEEHIEWLEERMTDLRMQLSEMRVTAANLHRDADLARDAYTSLARLEPLVSFFGELTPGNARILNTAFVPDEPNSNNRLVATVIAVLVTGMLVLMFAFLREAVKEPEPRPGVTRVE